MLKEQVLEELTRDTPLQQLSVETAWPGLCVESKLEVVQAVQHSNYGKSPLWLMQLCIEDPTAIVRFWGARKYSFTQAKEETPDATSLSSGMPATDGERLLRERARADASELVRACVSDDPWLVATPINRLVFARNKGTAHFICGLSKAFDGGLSDDESSDCLRELLQKPEVQADLQSSLDYRDGDTAYFEGKVLEDGWALARKAGPQTQTLLAGSLPTERGLSRITAAELATMPARVLIAMAYRRNKTAEIGAALERVLSSDKNHDESVFEDIRSGIYAVDDEEQAPATRTAPLNLQQESHAQVLSLQRQVKELALQLKSLTQLNSKRGWFS